jgi:hypothetical protein
MNWNTSRGMPRSVSTTLIARLTGARPARPYTIGAGMKPNMRALTRIVIIGAWPAFAKMFSTSPMR